MEKSGNRLHSVSGKDIPSVQHNMEQHNMEVDHISELHDSVICHVLFRLLIKDAVRTSILSKDWIYKWTSIYDINICYDRDSYIGSDLSSTRFLEFISRVLDLTYDSKLRSFRLSNFNINEFDQLKGWLSTVLSRDVENLDISAHLPYTEGMLFPQGFSSCSSLREMKLLLNCTIPIDNQICFPNLKHLCLRGGDFIIRSGGFKSPKLMIFPALKVLELSNFEWPFAESVEIRAPELTKVKVAYSFFTHFYSYHISIFAPRLVTFDLPKMLPSCFVVDAPSVTYAALMYEDGWHPESSLALQAHTILNWFSHLNHLKLSGRALQELMEMKLGHCSLSPLHHLKKLELKPRSQCYTEKLFVLLDPKVLPSLEYLYMNLECCKEDKYELRQHSSPCIAPQLRVIKFTNFGGDQCENHLVRFFLRNGKALTKASISLARVGRVTRSGMSESDIERNLSTHLPKSSTCFLHVLKPK